MKKFKAIISMIAVCAIIVSIGSSSVFAEKRVTIIDNMIDYTLYDTEMVYVQEHAEKVAQINEQIKRNRAFSYTSYNWNNGIYSSTSQGACIWNIGYSFTPVSNGLYFNIDIQGASAQPYLTVNKLLSGGTLSYVGSYPITSVGANNYTWENYKRTLTAGQAYVFMVDSANNWNFGSIDIYKSAM